MKILKFSLVGLLFGIASLFGSCSNDEKNEPSVVESANIENASRASNVLAVRWDAIKGTAKQSGRGNAAKYAFSPDRVTFKNTQGGVRSVVVDFFFPSVQNTVKVAFKLNPGELVIVPKTFIGANPNIPVSITGHRTYFEVIDNPVPPNL
jgi:hypothetical protein